MNVINYLILNIENLKKNPIIQAISIIWSDIKKESPSLIISDLNIIHIDCPIIGKPVEYYLFLKNGCENKSGET